MRVVVLLDNRTCVVSRKNVLRWDTKVHLKKLVNGRFGKRWKTVASTYYGLYLSEEAMLKSLIEDAERRRKSIRNKIRYNKLRKGL